MIDRKKKSPKVASQAFFQDAYTNAPVVSLFPLLHHDDPHSVGDCFKAWILSLVHKDIDSTLNFLVDPQFGDYLSSYYITSGSFSTLLEQLTVPEVSKAVQVSSEANYTIDDVITWLGRLSGHIPKLTSRPNPRISPLHLMVTKDIFSCLELLSLCLSSCTWIGRSTDGSSTSQIVFTKLDAVMDKIVRLEAWLEPVDKAITSFILTQLLVCAYQLAHLTAKENDAHVYARSLKTVENAAHLALSAALTARTATWRTNPRSLYEGVRGHLPSISNVRSMADYIERYRTQYHAQDIIYCVDAIVVVYHLLELHKLPDATFDFGTVFEGVCHGACPPGPVPYLAALIAYTRLVHPLTRLDARGMFSGKGFTGWNLLVRAVDAFLHLAFNNPDQEMQIVPKERARVLWSLLRHCCGFLKQWAWHNSDVMVMTLFKAYAKNDTIALLDFGDHDRHWDFYAALVDVRDSWHSETDSQAFLELVAGTLKQKGLLLGSAEPTVQRSASNKIRYLMFGLLPNSTRLFNTDRQLKFDDHTALLAHYDLYSVLYAYSPTGYQLNPKLVERFVDFPVCPSGLRTTVVTSWEDMMRIAARLDRRADIAALVEWGCQMLKTLTQDLKTMSGDDDSCDNTEQRVDTFEAITYLLRGWGNVVRHTLQTPDLMDHVLTSNALHEIASYFCFVNSQSTDKKPVSRVTRYWKSLCEPYGDHVLTLELLRMALSISEFGNHGARLIAEGLASSLVSAVLSRIDGPGSDGSDSAQRSAALSGVTEEWFKIARVNVDLAPCWDTYLLAPSPLSFTILADTEASRQSKVLFMARIIEDSPMTYIVDRHSFYAIWLEGLVLPNHMMLFEDVLSQQIYRHDQGGNFLGAVLDKYAAEQVSFAFSV